MRSKSFETKLGVSENQLNVETVGTKAIEIIYWLNQYTQITVYVYVIFWLQVKIFVKLKGLVLK